MRLYWVEWRAAAAQLERSLGLDRDGLEEERKDIHRRVLGEAYSSRDIVARPARFDLVLAAFRAISQPDNMEAQLDALRQPKKRIIWVIDRDLTIIGVGREYLNGILRRMSSEGAIPLHTDLYDYEFSELQRIATAVKRTLYAKRHS